LLSGVAYSSREHAVLGSRWIDGQACDGGITLAGVVDEGVITVGGVEVP